MSLDTLRKIEADIVRAIIAEALRLGYLISVDDEEGCALKASDHAPAIVDACAHTGMDRLTFHLHNGRKLVVIGSVLVVYGEGAECIADYTDNDHLQAIMRPALRIAYANIWGSP